MKIIIKKKVVLNSLPSASATTFHSIMKEKSDDKLKFMRIEKEVEGQEGTVFNIHFAPSEGVEAAVIDVNEQEMKYILNVLDNHYYGKMFIEYLGNGRFDLIFER